MPRKTKKPTKREIRPLRDVLIEHKSMSPEDLFRESGRDEADLESVEKFYAELRELLRKGGLKELRPSSARVLLMSSE